MSQSQHQAIALAVKAALVALCSGRVYEGRNYTMQATTASQINIFLEDSTPDSTLLTGAPVDWTTQVNVEIRARRTGTASAESAADAIWTDAWAAVMADQSLGGLVQSLVPAAVTRDRDEADTDVHCITWQFTVAHRTANNTLT